jgi:Ca-activated chloride channel family protein
MGSGRDYYTILGVLRDATADEIRQAYLASAQRFHPDKNTAAGETELFLEVQQAYEVISNPKRRKAYDAILPKVEPISQPFIHDILYSRSTLVRLTEPQLVYVLLEVKAQQGKGQSPTPPLNLCLVLDRSTSMKDVKMDLLKAAAIQVLRDMKPDDTFSVISFSDQAEVAIPTAFVGDHRRLEMQIRSIQPSGATEIFKGLEAGFNEVQRGRRPGCISHIILLTDGHTYGDETACLALAERAEAAGIGISVLGIGADWNDSFLDQVAGRTGNTSRYIARPQDIQNYLIEKFRELTSVFAEEVILDPMPLHGIRLNYAFRLQPEPGPIPLAAPLHLGAVLLHTGLSVLFEFMIEPSLLQTDPLCFLEGRLTVNVTGHPVPVQPVRVRFERPVSDDPGRDPPVSSIINALSRLTLYRIQERARGEARAGQFEKATRSLKNLASSLLLQGERSLAETVLLEAENIQQQRGLSSAGEKEIKYRTRALIGK